ncbi:Type 1 glutamine amidotransferase-like domain-containing protein [Vallitalea maricola]|uniref:Uncharacterized protein n=1 Tax=Vallitalea maricola TaxID=3074433 RepID=A0ACB5UFH8_9FIRM|nr:hypothetical protein AN2V17_09280 [Vallitalea sp. AN17-2]
MIYLLGGGFGFKEDLQNEFKSVLKNKNSITFIPTSPQDRSKCEKYKKVNLSWFSDIGINFDNVSMINQEDDVISAQDKIIKSNIIFLMGGDPITQLKFISDKKLENCLLEYEGIIIGISAGALSICKKCILTKDQDYPENIVVDGINLTNGINVDVHYTNEHDENLYQIIKEHKIDKVYAIPEDGALRIDNDSIKFVGEDEFYIIKQGLKEQVNITEIDSPIEGL